MSAERISAFLEEHFGRDPPGLLQLVRGPRTMRKLAEIVADCVTSARHDSLARAVELALRHIIDGQCETMSEHVNSDVAAVRREWQATRAKTAGQDRDYEREIAHERANYGKLEDKYRGALVQLTAERAARERLEAQLDEATGEFKAVVEELAKTKKAVTEKRKKLNKCLTTAENMEAELRRKEAEVKHMETEVALAVQGKEESGKKRRCEEMRLLSENGRLAAVIAELTDKVHRSQLEKQDVERTAVVQRREWTARADELETELARCKREKDRLGDELNAKLVEISGIETARSSLARHLAEATQTLKAVQMEFDDEPAMSMLPNAVRKLKDRGPLNARIGRLTALLNGFAAFISQMIEHGRSSVELLEGVDEFPDWLRKSIENKIMDCKRYVAGADGSSERAPLFEAALGQLQSTGKVLVNVREQPENAAVLSVFSSVTGKLVARANRETRQAADICNVLHIEPKAKNSALVDIRAYHETVQPVIDSLVSYTDGPARAEDVVEGLQLCAFKELQQFAPKGCHPSDAPDYIRGQFRKMRGRIRELNSVESVCQQLRHELTDTQDKLSDTYKEVEAKEQEKEQLVIESQQKGACIEDVTKQLEGVVAENVTLNEALIKMRVVNKELKEDCQSVVAEREQLKETIAEKTELYREQLASVVTREREKHQLEMGRLEKRSTTQMQRVEAELKAKSKKLKAQKDLVSDMQCRLEGDRNKMQAVIGQVQRQNEELVRRSQKEKKSLATEDLELLKLANQQRSLMMSRLSDLAVSGFDLSVSTHDQDLLDDLDL